MLMKRCVILSAAPVMNTRCLRQLVEEGDYIICADGGVKLAQRLGITPNLILGDFDSLDQVPDIAPVFTHEREKTTLIPCLRLSRALRKAVTTFYCWAAWAARWITPYANIQALCYLCRHGCQGYLMNDNIATIVENTTVGGGKERRLQTFLVFLFGYLRGRDPPGS